MDDAECATHDLDFCIDNTCKARCEGDDDCSDCQFCQGIGTERAVCHDYQPNGRELKLNTTVAESKRSNIHVAHVSKQDYVNLRNSRDSTLNAPALLYPSLQVNLWGGALPQKEQNGQRYIKIPLSQQRKD